MAAAKSKKRKKTFCWIPKITAATWISVLADCNNTGNPMADNDQSSLPSNLTAAVMTVSDSCASGQRADVSGPAVVEILKQDGFSILATLIIADDQPAIEQALERLASEVRLIVTTGGTGISARDVTPEATHAVCDRLLEGVAEVMRFEGRKTTPFAALSRGVCGVRGKSLILNLPGSPAGAVESLQAVVDLLPHAIELLGGNTHHG
jgi:molybdopterin adenylyltransferase